MKVAVEVRTKTNRVNVEARSGGAGGTKDYEKLINLPGINDVEIKGYHNGKYYGLVDLIDYLKDKEILDELFVAIAKEQQLQDEQIAQLLQALKDYKLEQAIKDNEQDSKINDNESNIINLKAEQTKQDEAIANVDKDLQAYKKQIELEQQAQDEALNEYKTKVDAEQEVQNKNIQQNALDIQGKVNTSDYEASEQTQNTLIQANKDNLAKYEEETRQGFLDERELSLKEHQEAIDLANEKAVINDLNISPNTTFSSYESATRFTCEKAYTGNKVTIKPVEGYPISTIVNIEAVRQPGGDYSGWNNVDVTQDNGGTHKVYNQELNAPCFGGTYEFHKGKLTITRKSKSFNGSEAWDVIPLVNGRKQQFVLRGAVTNSSNNLELQLCNKYDVPSVISPNFNGVWINNNDLFVGGSLAETFTSLDNFKASLMDRNLQIIYGLQVPEVENFEQQVINGQTGINTIYANTGDIAITTHVLPLCKGDVDESVSGIKLNGVLQIPDSDKIVNLEVITEGKVDVKIATAIAKVKTLKFKIVESLPATGEDNIIYLVPIDVPSKNNGYTEWGWIEGAWEALGTTQIDLSDVVKYTDIVEVEGNASNKVLSQKYVTEQLKLRVTNEALTNILKGYVTSGEITKFLDEAQVKDLITTYNFVTAEDVKSIKVDSASNSDNATKFATYDLETFKAQVIAKVEVDNAKNSSMLNNIPANDFALLLDIANMVEEPTEVSLNANTQLIRGWYKTNGNTANLPLPKEVDHTGFLRVLEFNHDSRNVLQIFYSIGEKVLYLRWFVNGQQQDWFILPSIDDKDRNATNHVYSAKQIETLLAYPQYNTMIVQVTQEGSIYKADKTALEVKTHIDGGGVVLLKHNDQVYEYQKYDNNDAVFYRVDISTNKAEEIDIRLDYKKDIKVVRTELDLVAYAKTQYVDDSIKQAILDSWGGSY